MSVPLIVRQDDLESFVARAKASPVLALDTEFVWTRTYYAGLGLIQAATLDETVLIDPLAVTDLAALRTLNESPDIVKIFHDPEMDLPILARGGCGRARNVFDTRTSAGFGGFPSIWSLGKLLCELTGIDLPKTEARTDWLARPLSDKQLSYAADDVHHMARMRDLLLQRARERGNEEWLNEEMLRWENETLYTDRDPRKAFRSVKGMGRLKHRQKAVLRELAAWRETTGKEHDITRNRIMRDEILLIVANFSPTSEEAVRRIRAIPKPIARDYATDIATAVQCGLDCPRSDLPAPGSRRPPLPEKEVRRHADAVLALISGKAGQRGIDPALVCARADATALVCDTCRGEKPVSRLLQGWRNELLRDRLPELLAAIPRAQPELF